METLLQVAWWKWLIGFSGVGVAVGCGLIGMIALAMAAVGAGCCGGEQDDEDDEEEGLLEF